MQDSLSIGLSVVALAIAVWICFHGWRHFKKLEDQVGPLLDSSSEMAELLRRKPDTESFARDLDEIEETTSQSPALQAAWRDYRRTLSPSEDQVIATREPSDYFNDAIAYRPEIDLRSYDAIPNKLIALGLLFTFLGLLLSLGVAGYGINGPFEQVKATLVQLLIASGFKFVTSIAAIGSSLWFVSKKNMLIQQVSRAMDAISDELQRLTVRLTAEGLAEETLAELEMQTSLLQKGSGDLAAEVARQLDLTLRANLRDAILPVATAIDTMSGRISEINEAAMRYMIKEFTEQLGGAAREHNQAMAVLFEQVARTVEDVPKRIEDASTRFSTVISTVADDMDQSLTRTSTALSHLLGESVKSIGATASAFEQVVEQLTRATERLDNAETAVHERAERAETSVRLAIDQLSIVLEKTSVASEALEPLTTLANRLEELSSALISSTADVNAFVSRSGGAAEQSRVTSEALAQSAASFSASVRELDSSLTGVFEQIAGGIQMFQTRVANVLEAMDDNLAAAVDTIGEAAANIGVPRPRKGQNSPKRDHNGPEAPPQ